MRKFGLIGYPLGHSFSKKYFTEKFANEFLNDAVYENFELPKIDLLPDVVAENPDLRGLNVTIPYKESVLRYLDELNPEAENIGAVNTIKISSGKLTGFNTDYVGFIQSLSSLLQPAHKNALILGTGGSSLAVKYALEKLGIEYLLVSRDPLEENETGYSNITEETLQSHTLIINTTPVGMFPDDSKYPEIPYQYLNERHLLFDLIYNPEETMFLKKGKERGAITKNGYEMLLLQAEEAWKIWSDF
jgi:shikimate dehydrogenase